MVRELYRILRGTDHAVEAVLAIDRSDIERDRLASAPAWRVGSLDEGSVVLAIDWAPTNMINDGSDIGAVADYLGMRA